MTWIRKQTPDAKSCPRCGSVKALKEFRCRASPRYPGERVAYCKPCEQEYKRDWESRNREKEVNRRRAWRAAHREHVNKQLRRWRKKNRQKVRAQARCRYQRDPERQREHSRRYIRKHRAELRESGRKRYWANPQPERLRALQYNKKHPDRCRAALRRYRAAHAEEVRERTRSYFASNPDKRRAYSAKRKALKRGARLCDLTAQEWSNLLESFGNCCAYCGQRKPLTQDHLVPLSRGGGHTLVNIVPACQGCNNRKYTLTPLEWFIQQIKERAA